MASRPTEPCARLTAGPFHAAFGGCADALTIGMGPDGARCNQAEAGSTCDEANWREWRRAVRRRFQSTMRQRRIGAIRANARTPHNAATCPPCDIKPGPNHLPSARLPTTATASPGASQARNPMSGARHPCQDAQGRREGCERVAHQKDRHAAAAAQPHGWVLGPDFAELEECAQQPGIQLRPPDAAKPAIENVAAHARRSAQQRHHDEVGATWLCAERSKVDA
jgi:hypothetical protein